MILLSAAMLPTALITKFLTGISVTFLLVIYIHHVATQACVTSTKLSLTVGALMSTSFTDCLQTRVNRSFQAICISYQRGPSLHCFAISDIAVTLSLLLCEVVSPLGALPPWFGPVYPKTGLLLACALLCFHLNPLLGFGLVLTPCFDCLVLSDHR